MSPEEQAHEEYLARLNELLAQQIHLQEMSMTGTNRQANATSSMTRAATSGTDAFNTLRGTTTGLTQAQLAQRQALKEAKEAEENLTKARRDALAATKSLTTSLLEVGGGFTKYTSTIASATGAVTSLTANFGTLGKTIGFLVKGVGMATEAYLKQSDAMLKAFDEMANFGAIGELTTKNIIQMGLEAGYSAKNLDKYIAIQKSLGTDMIGLGSTVNSGAKTFAELTKLNEKEIDNYRRMGVSQEQFNQNQADSIKLMMKSGQAITERMKVDGTLRQRTVEYTDSLLQLAALTGDNVESLKKQKEAALQQVATQIYLADQNDKAADLEKNAQLARGEEREAMLAQAKKIRDETKRTEETLVFAQKTMSPEKFASFSKMMTTGVVDAGGGKMLTGNPNLLKDIEKLKSGELDPATLQKIMAQAQDRNRKAFGFAASASSEAASALGMDDMREYENATKMRTKDLKELNAESKASRDLQKGMAGGTGKSAVEQDDELIKNRNKLLNTERDLQVGLEKLLLATNPLVNGFTTATTAATALAVGLGAATVALATMAGARGLGALKGIIDGLIGHGGGGPTPPPPSTGGTGATAGRTAGRLGTAGRAAGRIGSRALGALGPAGAVAGAGMAGYELGSYANEKLGISDAIVSAVSNDSYNPNSNPVAKGKITGTDNGALQKQAMPAATPPKAQQASNSSMSESDIKEMIKRHEGVRYKPYQDSLGLWTVGVGHLIGDGKTLPAAWNREFSKDEIDNLFDKDYAHHKSAAEGIPGFGDLNGKGKGALVDLTFNMGPSWISKWPKLKNQLSEKDVDGAANNLQSSLWYKQVGNRGPEITGLLREGVSAAMGGITSGPKSGYPATLHGTELITPLEPNSILEKLSKTAASDVSTKNSAISSDTIEQTMREMNAMHAEMMSMFEDKLNNMIDKLGTSNDLQDQLLKYSRI